MKSIKLIIILIFLAAATSPSQASLIDFGKETRQQLAQVTEELTQQRQATEHWTTVSASLAVGCVLLLVIGTALGSKVRRHAIKS